MRANPIQTLLVVLVAIGLGVVVVLVAGTKWYDWVVFGVIVLTAYGGAIAVNQRRYPTRKRSYTRRSDGSDKRFRDDRM